MNIALIGYGKMGKVIERIAKERGHSILMKIDKNNTDELTIPNIKNFDVAIEFTQPQAAVNNYMVCFEAGVPVVSGTTGWQKDFDSVKEAARIGARFFYSSNFSLGVNILFALNQKLAKMMKPYENYTVEIEETHHTEKLDSPSGTAITLAEAIMENNEKIQQWVNHSTEKEDELPIISKREPDVPGIHTVSYTSSEDVIRISHEAKSREGFALGAVLAAEFLVEQSSGIYGMNDLLDL